MTGGDRDLAREVIGIFLDNARDYLGALDGAADLAAWQGAAHKLKGAARGLGAWRLEELCRQAEAVGDLEGERHALSTAIAAAIDDIRAHAAGRAL